MAETSPFYVAALILVGTIVLVALVLYQQKLPYRFFPSIWFFGNPIVATLLILLSVGYDVHGGMAIDSLRVSLLLLAFLVGRQLDRRWHRPPDPDASPLDEWRSELRAAVFMTAFVVGLAGYALHQVATTGAVVLSRRRLSLTVEGDPAWALTIALMALAAWVAREAYRHWRARPEPPTS